MVAPEKILALASRLEADINASSAGSNTIVAAVAGRSIVILSYELVVSTDNVVDWEDSDGLVHGGPMSFLAKGGISSAFCPVGRHWLAVGKGLCLGLGAGAQVGGSVVYKLV